MEIILVSIAPVPIGHKVKVIWYDEVTRGLVPGQNRRDSRPHQPKVVDLDTGVEYLTDWAVGAGRRRHPDDPYDIGTEILEDHEESKVVEGTVTECQVVTVRGYPELDVQTRLVIDVDD